MYSDEIKANLGNNGKYVTHLFKTTFGTWRIDNHQRPLAWRFYRNTLPVRNKLYVTGLLSWVRLSRDAGITTKTWCMNSCAVPTFLTCWFMSNAGFDLYNIVQPPSFTREKRAIFISLTAMAKEWVRRTRLKRLPSISYLVNLLSTFTSITWKERHV